LLFGQKLEEPRHRKQQHFRISVVQVGPGQKVRTGHFQAVASGSVASQHLSRRLDRPLNDRNLALLQFEVDTFPRFRRPPRQFLLDLLLELLLGHFPCRVQPGCTIMETTGCQPRRSSSYPDANSPRKKSKTFKKRSVCTGVLFGDSGRAPSIVPFPLDPQLQNPLL